MTTKQTYFITFGQRSPFREGWIEVSASSKEEATGEAMEIFGPYWANIYEADQFTGEIKDMYPDGKFGHTIQGL